MPKRKRKPVANTLSQILDRPFIRLVRDKKCRVEDLVNRVMRLWSADLEKRSPPPAYIENLEGQRIYLGNDYDEFTFLMALANRRALVNIPYYERIAPQTFSTNRTVLSNENRHGEILAIITNDDAHSVSLRIKDYNVVVPWRGHQVVGGPTNFALVNYNGDWNFGFAELSVWFTQSEKQFLRQHELFDTEGEFVSFEKFVHESLSKAFFGARYLEAKALSARIRQEAGELRRLEAALRERGLRLPPSELRPKARYEYGPKEHAKVIRFLAHLHLPPSRGRYPLRGRDDSGKETLYEGLFIPEDMSTLDDMIRALSRRDQLKVLRYAIYHSDQLSYGRGASASAPSDIVELAMFQNGYRDERADGNERPVGWGIPQIQRNVQLAPRGRKWWSMIDFTPHLEGEQGVRLYWRLAERTVETDPSNYFESMRPGT